MQASPAKIIARYRIQCAPHQAASLARAMAWEQTVEVVESVVSAQLRERVVGEVIDLQQARDGSHLTTISYHAYLASDQIGQLFNLAYGNVSLYPQVRLEQLSIPDELADAIGGPRLGSAGIRELLGIHERPLLATVLKPRGESIAYFQRLARDFILGGGDVLKDDQNLVEKDFELFRQRVTGTAEAIEQATQKTGRPCLYFPHVTGAGDDLKRRLALIKSLRLQGVLLCPWVMGLGHCQQLTSDFELAYMAHPALAGSFTRPAQHGVAPAVLYGTLLRLAGADISIFPGHGGRITSQETTCERIQHALTDPLGGCLPSLPSPAGGKHLDLIPEMLDEYGADAMLLIGGALLAHGPDLQASTREYQAVIQARYPGRYTPLKPTATAHSEALVLKAQAGPGWPQRPQTVYKTSQDLPHANASRTELIGAAHQTNFELRYFELQPGGFTSHERHWHTHVIIGVRGTGQLQIGSRQQVLSAHDIAYVPPNSAHQLRNDSDAVFGFYCLVDRHRDKPVAAQE